MDEPTEDDTTAVLLPNAPLDLQARIGKLVVEAFEKKEEANKIEKDAIRLHIEVRQSLGEPIPIEVAIERVEVNA